MQTKRLFLSALALVVLLGFAGMETFAKKGGKPKDPPQPPEDPDLSFSPGSGAARLIIMNDDGTEGYMLPTAVNGWSSSWSPDGTSIAFDTGSRLFRVDAEAGWTDEELLDSDGVEPAWSPNDDWIAYSGNYMTSLKLVSPDGSETQTVHSVGPNDWIESPTWNETGTMIAFLEWPDGETKQLRMYELATDTITTIGDLPAVRIDWARTKDSLVYNLGSNIYTCDLNLESMTITSTTQIVQDGRWASWSPNDGQIVFSRLRQSIRWELYKYTFSTDAVTPITSGRNKKALPGRLVDWKR